MLATTMPYPRKSFLENEINRTKQKVNNIAISTKIFSNNIAYAIKNIPKDASTGLILFGGISIGDFIYSTLNFQSPNQNSEKNIVIVDKAGKKDTKTVANFKEKRDPKIISIEVGAGDPPLKIGNITINPNDLVTSFTDQLGIRDIAARFYATTIQKIRNSEYHSQYMQVIQIIDGFVKKGKISTKQAWALLLYITDDITFNKMFGQGSKMQKLFKDGLARDKDVKAFYEVGNNKGFIMSGGMFNPTYLGNLLAYSAKMETKSKATASADTDEGDPFANFDVASDDLQAELARKKALLKDKTKTEAEIKTLEKEVTDLKAKIANLK